MIGTMVDVNKDFQQKEATGQKEYATNQDIKYIENVACEVDKDGKIQKEYLDQQDFFHAQEVQVLENEVLPGIFEKFTQWLEQKFGFTFAGVNDNTAVVDVQQGFSKQSPEEQIMKGLSKDTKDTNENIAVTVHNVTNPDVKDATIPRNDATTGNTFGLDVTVSNAGKNVNNYTLANVTRASYYAGSQKPVVAGTIPDKNTNVFSLQAKESLTKTYNNFDFYTNFDGMYTFVNQKEELYKTGQGTVVTKDNVSYIHTGVNIGTKYMISTKNFSSKIDASVGAYPLWYTAHGTKNSHLSYQANLATYTTIGAKHASVNPYIETTVNVASHTPILPQVMAEAKLGLYIFKRGNYNYDIYVFGDYDQYSKTLLEEFKNFTQYTYGISVNKNLSFVDRNYNQDHNIVGTIQGGITNTSQTNKPSPFLSFGIKYYIPKNK